MERTWLVLGALALSVLSALSVCAEGTVPAQVSTQQSDEAHHRHSNSAAKSERDPRLRAMVDMAAAVPPEFAADVMIRLAESEKINDRAFQMDLLKRAFYVAQAAQQPVQRASLPGGWVDTRAGYLSMAFRMQMDRLSLQLRAVNAVLRLDSKSGRELLEQIQIPDLKPLDCEDPLAYDLGFFYQTLANIVRGGFTPREKREEQDIAFLVPYLRVQYHAQVGPVAQLLAHLDLPPGPLEELVGVFAGSLEPLRGDRRSFTNALRTLALDRVADLIVALDRRDIPSFTLIHAAREYLVGNLRDGVCRDIVGQPARQDSVSGAADYLVQRFNEQLKRAGTTRPQITEISPEDLQGLRVGPAATVHDYWQTPPAKGLLMGIKKLRFGDSQKALSEQERLTFPWETQLADFRKELETWKPDTDDAGDFFHEKCVLYEGLIELAPSAPKRSAIIDSFVEFLGQNYLQIEGRMEWFLHVHDLLERLHGDARRETLAAFLHSRDLVLNLYASLQPWLPEGEPRSAH